MNENVINLFVDATSFTRLRKAMLILAIRILAALPQQHRKVFRMRAEGYTFEDISKAAGIENGNVRCMISRIRKRVRLQMKTL